MPCQFNTWVFKELEGIEVKLVLKQIFEMTRLKPKNNDCSMYLASHQPL